VREGRALYVERAVERTRTTDTQDNAARTTPSTFDGQKQVYQGFHAAQPAATQPPRKASNNPAARVDR
jgi:hypothetical protein